MVSSPSQPEMTDWLSYFQSDETFSSALKYELPHGQLFVAQATIELEVQGSIKTHKIASECNKEIKKALQQQKRWLKSYTDKAELANVYSVLILDVILTKDNKRKRVTPTFGAKYFIEDFVMEVTEQSQVIQVFSYSVWQEVLDMLQTPCELWRFLAFHLRHLQQAAKTGEVTFASERALITEFLASPALLEQAIKVDNELVKYKLKTEPNATLVRMASAQNSPYMVNTETVSYEHMKQASMLWTYLYQCAYLSAPSTSPAQQQEQSLHSSPLWMRQLLDESLFSRYELIKELYLYPSKPVEVKQTGYVVHQHSYESLGRHYVLIFYGTQENTPHARNTLQARLQDVAKDVATRLVMPELHHIVILGIEFLVVNQETVVDMDVFIQSVGAMTEKERYLTEQLSALQIQQQAAQPPQTMSTAQVSQAKVQPAKSKPAVKLPSLQLKMKM
ncbi:hypothetical protein [Psychrobacter sp. I-STPA6b]|uniref:hypothetical protein n=1 Tax=Psychrobacter sp. I-STPA6b TaxID=2585718 RepID=UPI001D0C6B08|nr:hypothetical protein [Psychrobacter sp. I-STPA6b]